MEFQLRPITSADYPRMVEILERQVPDPPTVERLEKQGQVVASTPGMFQQRMGAVDSSGLLLGYGSVVREPMAKPGHIAVGVRVDTPFRNQGVGAALYAELERIARQQEAAVLTASTRESDPAGLAWAERRGFVQKQHLFESKLEVAGFDPSPFADSVPVAEASGIRFTSFAECPQDDEGLQRFIDFWWELSLDVPGIEGFNKPTLDLMKQQIKAAPEYWEPAAMIIAVDGDTWVALAWLQKQANGSYYHGMTGVKREYRGRGLALAIKLKALEYARSKGASHVRTNNDSNNQRMLAVNRRMGYKPEPGFFILERSLG